MLYESADYKWNFSEYNRVVIVNRSFNEQPVVSWVLDMNQSDETKKIFWRKALIRVYFSGFIALGLIYVVWRIIKDLSPWYSIVENPVVGVILTILTLVLVPPLLGCLVQYVVNPLMGRWSTWSELMSFQDRLVGELSSKSQLPIVLVNWPTESVRCMAILTSRFEPGDGDKTMAAVYIPTAPRAKTGYLRVVPLDELEITNWTFKEFQVFQWTLGSICPEQLHD